MKIAIIADPIDNQRGGVHVYTRELVRALLKYDRENEYLLVREARDEGLECVEQLAIPNYRVGLGLSALRLFFVLPLVLWWKGVDAVLEPAHFGPFNLPRRIRRITMIHDLTPILFPQYHRYHSQLLQRLFLGGILRRADLVLSNSKSTTRDLHHHYPATRGKVATILLGADHLGLEPVASRAYLQAEGIGHPYWLSVGTIEPRKNLLRLLEAYRRFREMEGEKVLLVVAGQQGWKSEAFYEALEQHPFREDIRLLGFVPDGALNELYSHAIGLAYVSEYEGFGFPVLEAFSCGCPVVCSTQSSLPEVGGKLAFYADAYQVEAIAEQMQRLYRLPPKERQELATAAIAWAGAFTWERYVENFRESLLRLGSPA